MLLGSGEGGRGTASVCVVGAGECGSLEMWTRAKAGRRRQEARMEERKR